MTPRTFCISSLWLDAYPVPEGQWLPPGTVIIFPMPQPRWPAPRPREPLATTEADAWAHRGSPTLPDGD